MSTDPMNFPITWFSSKKTANCSKLQYDPDTRVLQSTLGGRVYRYFEVPPEVIATGITLPNAEVGTWHAQTIVKGKPYKYVPLAGPLEPSFENEEKPLDVYQKEVSKAVLS